MTASLNAVWRAYQSGAVGELDRAAVDVPSMLYAGILGLAAQQAAAWAWIQAAGASATPRRLPALVAECRVDADRSLYETHPEAFRAFVEGGTNPRLYTAVHDVVAAHTAAAGTILDIGSGDGRVVEAVLQRREAPPSRVDIVEPSPLLHRCAQRLRFLGDRARLHGETIGRFLPRMTTSGRWDVVQSTFCLHSIPPSERVAILSQVSRVTDLVLIVEFDVPQFPSDLGPERFGYYCDRYEVGIAEYLGDANAAVQGFLIPTFLRSLLTERSMWEQSGADWAADLTQAGFSTEVVPVYDYWWAPAILVIGRARS
ncbi:MAG: class I SAM-dependent methyltransferase [Planctomycetota bacterium]